MDQLSQTFTALADPTRRAILARLANGEATVKELAEPFDISGPAITKHLKMLERAGLISRGREAQWRPCRLETQRLSEASVWIQQYRAQWEARFDRLDAFVMQLQAQGNSETTATNNEATTLPSKAVTSKPTKRNRRKP